MKDLRGPIGSGGAVNISGFTISAVRRSGTIYFRGWCHRPLSVFQFRIGKNHSRRTDRRAFKMANSRAQPASVIWMLPFMICQAHR